MRDCEHGQLARVCELCDLTKQLAAAERANLRLRERVRALELEIRYAYKARHPETR